MHLDFKYFYKLGHCPALSISEYKTLNDPKEEIYTDKNWIFANHWQPIVATGSLVFGGRILHGWEYKDFSSTQRIFDRTKFYDHLKKELPKIMEGLQAELPDVNFKKLGVATPKILDKDILNIIKQAGVKKVNLLEAGKMPNYGNFSNTKTWLIFFQVANQIYLGLVLDYSDQQFWSQLDEMLPSDMKRGIINLKLARSLLNLTKYDVVYDPFCGQNRNLVAGLDLKKQFLSSDIDFSCVFHGKKNWEIGTNYYNKSRNYKATAELIDTFCMDAAVLDTLVEEYPQMNWSKTAIVTEGTLGKNFTSQPTEEEIKAQFGEIKNIWKKVLYKASRMDIPEIVFCLPFYQIDQKSILPHFLPDLLEKTGYSYVPLQPKTLGIPYSREKTVTGHLILKVRK